MPFLVLAFLFSGAAFANAQDWAKLYNNSGERSYGVDYYDSDTGAILLTDSGGSDPYIVIVDGAWEDREVYTPTSEVLRDIEFLDKNSLIAVGENGTIIKSDDLGVTWDDVSIPISTDFNQIEIYDSARITHIWVVGDNGIIYKSTNGGDLWTLQASGATKDLNGIYALDASTVIIVGDDETVLKTSDSGSTWALVRYGYFAEFYDVYYSSSTNGIVAASDGLYYTTNGGAAWTAFSEVSTNSFYTLDFYSSSQAAAVGRSVAYTTDDGGATWTSVEIPDEEGSEYLYDVEYFGDSMMIAGMTSYMKSIFFVSDDEDPSTVTDLSSDSPSIDGAITLTWTAATDNMGVSTYGISIDGGEYMDVGDIGEFELGVSEGSHEILIHAVDISGRLGDDSAITVVSDRSGPEVSTVSPISATQDEQVTLTVTASDNLTSVGSCSIYLNGVEQGEFTASGSDEYTVNYTFTAEGSYSTYAICQDELGNSTTSASGSITVGAASTTSEPVETEPTETDSSTHSDSASGVITDIADLDTEVLIKSQCIESTSVNDPCRAVYYYDADGDRHAFPNSKVYFTWYESFDDIILVTSDVMADASLGVNVTYHPGTKMVKFQSVDTVYVVEQGGVLRAIASEAVATDLYGSDWNTQIDDISDAFFSNYSFGDDVDDVSDYDVDDAIASVSSPEDNF